MVDLTIGEKRENRLTFFVTDSNKEKFMLIYVKDKKKRGWKNYEDCLHALMTAYEESRTGVFP